jgi:acyl carrier protein
MTDDQAIGLIQEALASVAPKRKADFAGITLATTIDQLQLDSIATMEMVGQLEERTGKTFPDEDLARVMTLGDLAGLVQRR